jgi:cell division protein FtsQ
VNAKSTIRKFLFITLWLIIGSGMLTLLLAAISKKNHELCRDYTISIKGSQNIFFVTEKDVQQLLATATHGAIKGQSLSSFNLHGLEELLDRNVWIKDAELYFDNQDMLHINITEREPIARIFTTAGNSFYIDNVIKQMPLSDKLSARVPVFTGFPDGKVLTNNDSLLLNDVKTMAAFIFNDPFWMAQVSEIDITPERNFEMIPVVGNHVVKLGNGENIGKKFHRLFVFYKEVLSKTGFAKYKVIDVQYAGQVIASEQTGTAKVDSAQLRKNVEKLLQQAMDSQADTITDATKPLTEKPIIKVDSTTASTISLKVAAGKRTLPDGQAGKKPTSPNPVKSTLTSRPDVKTIPKTTRKDPKPVNEKRIPKAVMPKKEAENGEW